MLETHEHSNTRSSELTVKQEFLEDKGDVQFQQPKIGLGGQTQQSRW